jgi:tRNA threonylcarbamoyladenosine biosynthesis protein TsaB
VTASAPLILALETATSSVSAALLRGEQLIAEECGERGRSAAELLLPCVDTVLRKADLSLGDIEAFAVSVGPGSFTSLRVGIATVKGLAFESGCPVAPVRTLAALALAAGPGSEPVVTMLDARRGEIYAGAWKQNGSAPHSVLPEGVYTPDQVVASLSGACRLAGEGALLFHDALADGLGPDAEILPELEGPSARHIGVLGSQMLDLGLGVDPADLTPHYVRRADAEVKRTGLRFEGL